MPASHAAIRYSVAGHPSYSASPSRHQQSRDTAEAESRILERLFSEEEIFPSDFEIKHPSPYAYATPLRGGVALLHMAVEFCDVEMARWLLEHGADVNAPAGTDRDGFGGWTPLFHAMVSLHVPRSFTEIADLLLAHGADPKVRASLRKPTTEGGEVTWRDVTAPRIRPQIRLSGSGQRGCPSTCHRGGWLVGTRDLVRAAILSGPRSCQDPCYGCRIREHR